MKYRNNDIVLLLTATVTPQFNYMAHKPTERLEHYISAIKWYLENTPYKLVIGENSNYCQLCDTLDRKYRERVELISWQETNTSRTFGYNEFLILKKVYQQSLFVKEAKLIIKITGRLIVKNIKWHIRQLQLFSGDYIAADIHRSLVYIDSRFFAFTVSKYEEILAKEDACCAVFWDDIHSGKSRNGDDGKYVDFESTIGAVIKESFIADKSTFKYLWFPIYIEGIEGYKGIQYRGDLYTRLILACKKLVHLIDWYFVVLPSIK